MNIVEQLQAHVDISTLPLETLVALNARMSWLGLARPDQLPPEDYFVWLLLAGRGSGKTRSGAEDIWFPASQSEQRIAVVGPTSNDVRKTCFEGESGLLNVIPQELIKQYNRSGAGELWLTSGSYFVGYSAEEPERLRGPQHHRAWCDELAAWRYLEETWDQLLFGLRLGSNPNIIVTTTPKPVGLVRQLVASNDTFISRASTFDNAKNLPKKILDKLRAKFEGTRLGRQELSAEILDDNPNALWSIRQLDELRVQKAPTLKRIVVAVDPPASSGPEADECGIVVMGVDFGERGYEHGYVLADMTVQGLSPEGWSAVVRTAYRSWDADVVVAEVNNGGDMVESVIRAADPSIPVKKVHATRGKVRRAEPVAMLYEQKRVHHVGTHGSLEDQMSDFSVDFDTRVMGYSPDRVDSLVWAATELMVEKPTKKKVAGAI